MTTARRSKALAVIELDEAGLPPDRWGDLTVTGRPRCKGIKPDGTRCGSFRGRSGYCFAHDPGVDTATRRAATAKGGANNSRAARAEKLMPPRLRGVFARLERAMDDVIDGTLPPTRASALAALASASVRVLVSGELEEQVRRLQETIGDGDDPTPPPALCDGE